jgi:hypothetical protein
VDDDDVVDVDDVDVVDVVAAGFVVVVAAGFEEPPSLIIINIILLDTYYALSCIIT